MLDIRNLCVDFGQRSLFHDVNLILQPGRRYGVTGANGTGKSTFLKCLAGEETPNHGQIEKAKNLTIGILKQDHFRYENQRIVDVVIQGNPCLWQALTEKDRLLVQPHLSEAECYRLAALEETILHNNGYAAPSITATLLIGLGIEAKYHDGPLSALSGGYKLRVLLAQVLFQKPDIMLLDEPTNHLDIVSIAWLEDFLIQQFEGLLIFVSHDRQLLNNLPTHILDIDYGTITPYTGNYVKSVQAKAEIQQQKQSDLQHKQKQIETMQNYVDRFGAKASQASRAKSKLKMIERIELPEIKDSSLSHPFFHFIQGKPCGKSVLTVDKISKQFDQRCLLKDVTFNLNRGEKCAIIGANGIGKSTLLKILLSKINADHGEFAWHENVSIGYFAQDYRSEMQENLTVWQWIEEKTNAPSQEMRNTLGQVLFRKQTVDKKLSMLSGGESARLVLASLILVKPNVLILDEPTNHLDLETIDALIEGLKQFHGTVLFVSHNRYFIDCLATRIIAITEQHEVRNYLGNYHDYLARYGKDYLESTRKLTK